MTKNGKNGKKTQHFGKIMAFMAFDENRDFRVSVIIYMYCS